MRYLLVVLLAVGCTRTAAAPASLSGGAPSSRAAVVAITDPTGTVLGGSGALLSPHVAITSADVVAGIEPFDLRVAIADRIGTTAVLAGVTRVEMDADG